MIIPTANSAGMSFFEIIARLGVIKYFDTKQCTTPSEAIHKFITENVLAKAESSSVWYDEFRWNSIYTLKIDDLLKKNLDGLDKLFRKYKNLVGITLDRLREMTRDADVELKEGDFLFCFAHCKMTVLDEISDSK